MQCGWGYGCCCCLLFFLSLLVLSLSSLLLLLLFVVIPVLTVGTCHISVIRELYENLKPKKRTSKKTIVFTWTFIKVNWEYLKRKYLKFPLGAQDIQTNLFIRNLNIKWTQWKQSLSCFTSQKSIFFLPRIRLLVHWILLLHTLFLLFTNSLFSAKKIQETWKNCSFGNFRRSCKIKVQWTVQDFLTGLYTFLQVLVQRISFQCRHYP